MSVTLEAVAAEAARIRAANWSAVASLPKWSVGNDRTSDQPLGDATVAVSFDFNGCTGAYFITGVDLHTGFVPAHCFAPEIVSAWSEAIGVELETERRTLAEDVGCPA